MSRLYLAFVFAMITIPGMTQSMLGKYLEFAQLQYDKGDYFYALKYYDKAMQLDSSSVDIIWKYAETQRAYKNYKKAEFYYGKVYQKEEAKIYPSSLLNYGLMQKQNGKYSEALSTFKKAKKKYYKQKKSYLYQKAKKEVESTAWAKSSKIDTAEFVFEQLPTTVNTRNSEFGHAIINDQFLFSSLRADSISASEEVYSTNYHTTLYKSKIEDTSFRASERIEALYKKKLNTGNGSFSLDSSRFYFSRCTDNGFQYTCKIMVAQYSNKQWTYIDSLGEIINEKGANTTMPCIAALNGKEVLIFASDRQDTEGGLDLFYSPIRNGNQYGKVRAIKTINSMDNELTPWWDAKENRLYFSSSWHNGFGGYDVFYSEFTTKFNTPINAGLPINSPANDLYYFKNKKTGYVSSNRIGVLYSTTPTCCSDIFSLKPPVAPVPQTREETLEELNKRLPVTLYFHNDRPNPKSWEKTTTVNYMDSYNKYSDMIETYKTEYAKGLSGTRANEAGEDIESFFIEYVDQGVRDLELFQKLLINELDKGAKINITIKGFASPLAKTDYNVNLTKRRIASLVNYMRACDEGRFEHYIDGTATNGGKVIFSQVPFGEYTANQETSDNPNDVQNSVYSRAAARERKIEIQSVTYFKEDNKSSIVTKKSIKDFGISKQGELLSYEFIVTNSSENTITIDSRIPCACTTAEIQDKTLQPGASTIVKMTVDTKNLSGIVMKSIYLQVQDSKEELQLYISSEVKE